MCSYDAVIWGKKAGDSRIRRQTEALQRPFLLQMCRAFRTTPTTSLQVIAGIIPLHIEARGEYEDFRDNKLEYEYNKITGKIRTHPANKTPQDRTFIENNNDQDEIATLQIYVDASRTEEGRVGIGLVMVNGDRTEERYLRLTDNTGIVQAEGRAIMEALRWAENRQGEENAIIAIRTDSLLTVNKIRQIDTRERQTMEMKLLMEKLNKGDKTTCIYWTDRNTLRQRAPTLDGTTRRGRDKNIVDIEMRKTKRALNIEKTTRKINLWQELWNREKRGKMIGTIIPTVGQDRIEITFKTTQVIAGHGYLNEYYRRFRLRETDGTCACGGGPENTEHVIHNCTREDRLGARRRTIQRLKEIQEEYPPRLTRRNEDTEMLEIINSWGEDLIIEDRQFEEE